jgi:hypothetical protein
MAQPTPLKIEEYERLPFTVLAVQVTPQNIYQVAKWCRGQVRTEGKRKKYIQVEVRRALNERQTKAYVGDYVLKAGTGFKIYTPKAFEESFQKVVKDMVKVVKNMVQREKDEDKVEADQVDSTTEDYLPQGGHNTSFISPAV